MDCSFNRSPDDSIPSPIKNCTHYFQNLQAAVLLIKTVSLIWKGVRLEWIWSVAEEKRIETQQRNDDTEHKCSRTKESRMTLFFSRVWFLVSASLSKHAINLRSAQGDLSSSNATIVLTIESRRIDRSFLTAFMTIYIDHENLPSKSAISQYRVRLFVVS